MDRMNIIKENWAKESLFDISKSANMSLSEILAIAFQLKLYKKETPNIARRWEKVEEEFLLKHSKELSVRDASNLLYRSHYATYQRIKYLGLEEMINRK